MVAWLIWLSTSFWGSTEIGVRLPAVFLGVGTAFFIFLFGNKINGYKGGLLSALFFSSTIGAALSSYIMTIDAPLLFFWSGSMYFLWLAQESVLLDKKSAYKYILIAGFLTGLGYLSKQTMIAFTAMSLFFIILFKETRWHLTKYLVPFLAPQIFCLIPPLYWNYKHNWITFSHTAHHFEHGNKSLFDFTLKFNSFFELIGSQFGIITPIIFLVLLSFGFCVLFLGIRYFLNNSRRKLSINELLSYYLVFLGLIPLLAVFLLSFKQRINANWPAPFYLSMSVLIVPCYWEIVKCSGDYFIKIKRLVPLGIVTGGVLVICLYLLPIFLQGFGLLGKDFDPTLRLRGWKALASNIEKILDSFPQRDKIFIVARRRQTVSELAFYLKDQPKVYRWNGKNGKIKSQYELWQGPYPKWAGKNGLVVFDAQKDLKGLDKCFKEFSFLKEIKIPLGSNKFRIFKVYLGKELISWKE